ncbi:MAG: hypothetical protein LC737_10500, partial [Chloroflexi bacterium]|nr:hypothetical protein [Chloroflexota bacterium]
GLYVFCARAWRLKADGYKSRNIAEMSVGTESHRAHGAEVVTVERARRASIVLFMLALIVFALWFLLR